jgi:hypothetical protein
MLIKGIIIIIIIIIQPNTWIIYVLNKQPNGSNTVQVFCVNTFYRHNMLKLVLHHADHR